MSGKQRKVEHLVAVERIGSSFTMLEKQNKHNNTHTKTTLTKETHSGIACDDGNEW